MKTYKLRKGKHSSGLRFKPHYNKCELGYTVIFDNRAIYDLGTNDQKDINKLFGLSYGLHHTNSIRFGWRPVGNSIEILSYCYFNRQRLRAERVAIVDLFRPYYYQIKKSMFNYILTVSSDKSTVYKHIYHSDIPKWGYQLYPYFGGNCPAPHDIEISFSNHNLVD